MCACCGVCAAQAYDVARSGLAHEPSNSKAWVRLGDACREAGRWQLAALSYRAALDLGSGGDADVQVSTRAVVRSFFESGRWQLAVLANKAALDLGSGGDADVQVITVGVAKWRILLCWCARVRALAADRAVLMGSAEPRRCCVAGRQHACKCPNTHRWCGAVVHTTCLYQGAGSWLRCRTRQRLTWAQGGTQIVRMVRRWYARMLWCWCAGLWERKLPAVCVVVLVVDASPPKCAAQGIDVLRVLSLAQDATRTLRRTCSTLVRRMRSLH